MKRVSDSILAVGIFRTAQQYMSTVQNDSAISCISKSLAIASEAGFLRVEADCYELLASIYDNQANWEETLRNLLRAASAYTKYDDMINVARISRTIAEKYFTLGVYKKSAQFSEQEFLLYNEQNLNKMASAAEMAGKSYYYLPVDSLASRWYSTAASYYEKDADTAGFLRCTEKLGSLYIQLGMYDQALKKYQEVLKVHLLKNDYGNIALTYNQLGFLMFKKNDVNAALDNFRISVEFSEKKGINDFFLTDVWSNIAICHQNLGNQKEMLSSFEAALQHAKESERIDEAARIERILATIYFQKEDNYHAELYCLSCIESAKASGNLETLQFCYKDYSSVLESGNDFVKALEYYEKHLNLRDSLNYESRLSEKATTDRMAVFEATEERLRRELAKEEIEGLELKTLKAESARSRNEVMLLQKQQELDRSEKDRLEQSLALEQEKNAVRENEQKVKTLEHQREIQQLQIERKDRDSLILQEQNRNLEQEKIQKETELKNEKIKRQLAMGIGSLMVLVAVIILYGLISTRKKNQKLAESKRQIEKINADLEATNAEVLKQKEIIEQKNQSITDSIQYASRIQTAVLPPINFLGEWSLKNFILFKPKDIVSGDFYWGVKKNEKIIVAAGDCTGHGVPGAFMSMLGHAFLDEILSTTEVENAATILNNLRDEVINTLKQKGTAGETRDGMDISLCILDLKAGRLDYAGANNPLYIIRDGKIIKYQADRMPIGIHFISFTPFTNQSIKFYKGDYLYLFTDGYADQFGGPNGRKFMYKPFQNLLLKIHNEPMDLQKDVLDKTFEEWKGDHEQVDDVLVIGIHL
jgi:serine phosphatase RsbU (regulator of sigma subunit)